MRDMESEDDKQSFDEFFNKQRKKIKHLRNADDIALMSKTDSGLKSLIESI